MLSLALIFLEVQSMNIDTGNNDDDDDDYRLSNQSESSESSEAAPIPDDIETKLNQVAAVMQWPCSEEGLQVFLDIREKSEEYSEHDPDIYAKSLRYKAKCSYTFIANLFPFWSNEESKNHISDWTDIANFRMENYKGNLLRRRSVDVSFINDYQALFDPRKEADLERSLLFAADNDTSSASSSRHQQKIADAKAAFANGKSGYCWPMQSQTFVETNQLMEKLLIVFYQDDNQVKHQVFASSFLNNSFNLYSICKNLQKYASSDNVDIDIPDEFKAIAALPMTDVSLEEADFAAGYVTSLRKTIAECSARTLISFSATEETISYSDNIQVRNYLLYETNLAKQICMTRCLRESGPRRRYKIWLRRAGCSVSVLANAVIKVARNLGTIETLKSGNVGEATSSLADKHIQALIVKQMRTKIPRKLVGLLGRKYEMNNNVIEKICIDFKVVYNDKYVDSLSYLIHHYKDHHLIVSLLNDEYSDVLMYYLTYLLCQNVPGSSSSALSQPQPAPPASPSPSAPSEQAESAEPPVPQS